MQRIMLVRSRSAIVCYQQLRYSPVAQTETAARCSSRWSASYDTRVTRAGTRVRLIGDGAVARGARAIAAAGARREGPRFPWCSHRGSARLWTSDSDTITLSVRRLGYLPLITSLIARGRAWDTVVVELNASRQSLGPVTVTVSATRRALGLREFEERRAMGLGLFVPRDQIASRNTSRPSDVLRGMRGVNLVRLRSGGYGVRFTLYTAARAGCAPDIWIDGQLARGREIDDLASDDVEAIELYQSWSTVPLQFSQGSVVPCGTIVIWTRVPGK